MKKNIRNFISLSDFSRKEIINLINLSADIKRNIKKYKRSLNGNCIGLLFEKPSLRTKSAFYVGTLKLGGSPIYFSPFEIKLGERESIPDVARTLSKYLDCVVLRTFAHSTIEEFTRYSSLSVINGLSDKLHPSQVLGDILTLKEIFKDRLYKIKITFIGDGNNVCHSLMHAASILGLNLYVCTPKGYSPQADIIQEIKMLNPKFSKNIVVTDSIKESIENAHVVYTDVWVSMGKEEEAEKRYEDFKAYQVNLDLLKYASSDCVVMHCLPAQRGKEITDEVIDSERSVVFKQAENRLFSACAILLYVLNRI